MIHSSGITTINGGLTFWTQVDNSSPAEIYEIDTFCNVLRTVKILNVTKTDWEELCSDDKGNLYLGNFGNNNNNRTNLSINIISNKDLMQSDSVQVSVINFNYGNQFEFPPAADKRNFDMEAMVWYNDSLHLFSKNRTDPFTGYTYQYDMPAKSGNYKLYPVDSFKTGDGPMVFFWITAAAVNFSKPQLLLLSHDRVWLFEDFKNSRFFSGNSKMILLPTYSQKEGICHANNNKWFITDEYFPTLNLGGNLYQMELAPLTAIDDSEEDEMSFEIRPNPIQGILQILLPSENEEREIKIFNAMGELCLNYTISKLKNTIPIQHLTNGVYSIVSFSKKLKKTFCSKVLVIN
jgi:hypothetical protein